MNSVSKVLVDSYARAAVKTAGTLTTNIRSLARQAGWPTSVALQLEVKNHSDGKWYVGYPKGIEKQVLDLEYGTQNTSPNPVIRDFIRTLDGTDLTDEMVERLIEVGVI